MDHLVVQALLQLGDRLGADGLLAARAPREEVRCLLGSPATPVLLRVQAGRTASVSAAPAVMPDAQFAFRATPQAWFAFWRPVPPPGWHDLLALLKRGEATLDGDLRPFMVNLQFFKDLLALPRGRVAAAP